MTTVEDAATVAAEDHHAELWAELIDRTQALTVAVAHGVDAGLSRRHLVDFLDSEVAAHLRTEEEVVYALADGAGQQRLVQALELDHAALMRQIEAVRSAVTDFDAALAARAVLLLFALRMEKEEKVLLPALADLGLAVGEVLHGRPELLGGRTD